MTEERPLLLVLHGPNMNMLGVRLPQYYGHATLKDLELKIADYANARGFDVECQQSNHEGRIVNWIHEGRLRNVSGIIINPAAFTHTSIPIREALQMCKCPIIEVHFGNPFARDEKWRKISHVSYVATGIVAGFRHQGYFVAIDALAEMDASARAA